MKWSNARPLACMHAVHRRTIDCRVRSKISGMSAMVPAATVTLATRSSVYTTFHTLTASWGRNPKTRGKVTWVVRPQGHFGRSIDSRMWLSDDADVRMFGVVEPVGWESAVDTLTKARPFPFTDPYTRCMSAISACVSRSTFTVVVTRR